jgi:hypothetical protein
VLSATDDSFKNITGGIQSIVTASAVIIGGVWAYFKFVRGRTYRPRLAVEAEGQWLKLGDASPPRRGIMRRTVLHATDVGTDVFHTRVRVTNIGASKVTLKQYGTGLTVSLPARDRLQLEIPDEVRWEYIPLSQDAAQPRTFEIFLEHDWIEPGETVVDDLLLDLQTRPAIVRLEVHLRWGQPRRTHRSRLFRQVSRWRLYRLKPGDRTSENFPKHDIQLFARRIIPLDKTVVHQDQPR